MEIPSGGVILLGRIGEDEGGNDSVFNTVTSGVDLNLSLTESNKYLAFICSVFWDEGNGVNNSTCTISKELIINNPNTDFLPLYDDGDLTIRYNTSYDRINFHESSVQRLIEIYGIRNIT